MSRFDPRPGRPHFSSGQVSEFSVLGAHLPTWVRYPLVDLTPKYQPPPFNMGPTRGPSLITLPLTCSQRIYILCVFCAGAPRQQFLCKVEIMQHKKIAQRKTNATPPLTLGHSVPQATQSHIDGCRNGIRTAVALVPLFDLMSQIRVVRKAPSRELA